MIFFTEFYVYENIQVSGKANDKNTLERVKEFVYVSNED